MSTNDYVNMVMHTEFFDTPWPYLITDSALDESEWILLQSYLTRIQPTHVPPNSDGYVKRLFGNETDPIDATVHDMLFNKILSLYNTYYVRLGGTPLEPDLACVLEFRYIGVGYRYHTIHTDVPRKRMSNVLYVSPQTEDPALGTELYSGPTQDQFVRNVGWKSNRIVSFVADQQRTWHNFGNASDQPRMTINMILGYPRELLG